MLSEHFWPKPKCEVEASSEDSNKPDEDSSLRKTTLSPRLASLRMTAIGHEIELRTGHCFLPNSILGTQVGLDTVRLWKY